MSWARVVYLYCDHPDCQDSEPYTVSPNPTTEQFQGDTAVDQRQMASRDGWVRRHGLDLCKEHREWKP
jgi:hypothetical protein